jgi:hypothetical protein
MAEFAATALGRRAAERGTRLVGRTDVAGGTIEFPADAAAETFDFEPVS